MALISERNLVPSATLLLSNCCHHVLQAGEAILQEEAPVQTNSRFFIIEEGTVECRKTFQVMLTIAVAPPSLLSSFNIS